VAAPEPAHLLSLSGRRCVLGRVVPSTLRAFVYSVVWLAAEGADTLGSQQLAVLWCQLLEGLSAQFLDGQCIERSRWRP
jgi:hypothetical protein